MWRPPNWDDITLDLVNQYGMAGIEAGADAMLSEVWKYIPVELQRCVFGEEEHGNDKDKD